MTTQARRIEAAEASFTAEIGRACDGLVTRLDDGGGVGVFVGDSPFDKVIGVGFAPVDVAALAAHEAAVTARGGQIEVELSTLADPALATTLCARGYAVVGFEDVLGLALPSRTPPASHAIHDVAAHEIAAWLDAVATASIAADDSDVPAAHEAFTRDNVARALRDMATASGYHRFVARIDGAIAGGASLRIHGGIAQFGGAATAPRFRRRGIQASLLAARLAAASDAGCDLAVVTTQPGTRSQANVMRAGFSLRYTRVILRR